MPENLKPGMDDIMPNGIARRRAGIADFTVMVMWICFAAAMTRRRSAQNP
jgi:uncharacterized protein (DUF2342 family)